VFCGTGAFGAPSLRALVGAGFEVPLVVTQPDRPAGRSHRLRASPIKELAAELGLRIEQPGRLRDPEAMDVLGRAVPDAIVVVSYGQILRRPVLELPPLGCLNVHGSMLPRHRGASPVHAAILAGDATTGVTVIRMDEGVDTGPIVASAPEPVRERDTFQDLHDRLAALGGTLIVPAILGLANGSIVPAAQDESRATRCRILEKADGRLDWTRPAVELDRAVRALNPWPGTFGTLARRTGDPLDVAILEAEPVPPPARGAPGEIVRAAGGEIVVACGGGALALRRLRPSGRNALDAAELLRGYGLAPGDAFVPVAARQPEPS
jgi:methionyl-tRNA formyltransferase